MMNRMPPRILAFSAALAVPAFLFAAIANAQQQSPSTSTSPTTNLGTMIVAPQKAPSQSTATRARLRVQRQALNFNLGIKPPASASAARTVRPAPPPQQQVHVVKRVPPRPLHVFAPKYPTQALAARKQGTVTVAFTIKPNGSTANIRIVDSTPPGVFDRAARAAVSRWLFQPAMADGRAVTSQASQTLVFRPPAKAKPATSEKPESQPAAARKTPANSVPNDIYPTHLVAPRYPPNAYRSRQGGSVTVSFMVTRNGRTRDIKVITSRPRHIFDNAAVKAVRQWRFKPAATPTKVVQTIHFTPPD